ncbi:hypothetical protein EPN52_07130 [bacterium]|nr:MAG: hypothetical protein EPN52_07130 [bacterium]
MATYVLALIGCAVVFGGLAQYGQIQMASWDPEGLAAVPALLRGVSVAGTLVIPAFLASRRLRALGAFLFGLVAAVLVTGPIFALLALEGRLPHF